MTKLNPVFQATIRDKKLYILNRERFDRYIETLGNEIEIIVRKKKQRRSLSQNALYWVYLNIIAEDSGHTPDELHDIFKEKFIPSEKVTAFGIETHRYKTTTDMDKLEFYEYMDKIQELTGIPIPNQEELLANLSFE